MIANYHTHLLNSDEAYEVLTKTFLIGSFFIEYLVLD